MTEQAANGDPDDKWAMLRQTAESRPSMYIGDTKTGHNIAIRNILRLTWQAKVFRRPEQVHLVLSPNQYIARVYAGPLIRPIQQVFSFGGGETLSEPWSEEGRAYFERIMREDKKKGIPWLEGRTRRGWRYAFTGPTGPRLASPSYPCWLSRRLLWGLRTDRGFWLEGYEEGRPVGGPMLLPGPSPVALLVAAWLDSRWFTGLPFTAEDAERLLQASRARLPPLGRWPDEPPWKAGEIVAEWHREDDLAGEDVLEADTVRRLIG